METPPSVAANVLRGGVVESRHRVHLAVASPDGDLLAHAGDPDVRFYLRSSAKPFQAVPLVTTGAADAFGFSEEELAIATASHNGEPRHVAAVRSMLEKAGVPESALACGVQDRTPQRAKLQEGENQPVHNNCSGKHAGMLAVAAHLGAPLDGYLEPDHPVQRLIRDVVLEAGDLDEPDLHVGVDGCGVPTFHLPLRSGARAVAVLANPAGLDDAVGDALDRLGRAMARHPWFVAGTGRFDTDLMEASEGLVVKGGAEGVLAVANRHAGRGLLLKVEDGNSRAVPPVATEVLRQLGWLDERAFEILGDRWRPPVLNHAGRVVGRIEPVLDLDLAPDLALRH